MRKIFYFLYRAYLKIWEKALIDSIRNPERAHVFLFKTALLGLGAPYIVFLIFTLFLEPVIIHNFDIQLTTLRKLIAVINVAILIWLFFLYSKRGFGLHGFNGKLDQDTAKDKLVEVQQQLKEFDNA